MWNRGIDIDPRSNHIKKTASISVCHPSHRDEPNKNRLAPSKPAVTGFANDPTQSLESKLFF